MDWERALQSSTGNVGEGDLFRAAVSESVRWTIDTAGLKAEFGEDWGIERSKPTVVVAVRVGARTAKAA